MKTLVKFFYFFMIWFYIIGTIGGIGFSLYNDAWYIAIAIIGLAYMAFPKVKEYYKSLTE